MLKLVIVKFYSLFQTKGPGFDLTKLSLYTLAYKQCHQVIYPDFEIGGWVKVFWGQNFKNFENIKKLKYN